VKRDRGTPPIPVLKYRDERLGQDPPFGPRGGLAIRHRFPVDGEYPIQLRPQRPFPDYLRGFRNPGVPRPRM